MPTFKIFSESKADNKFIKDFVLANFNKILTDEDFYQLGSWSGYKSSNQPIAAIKENFVNDATIILILDADQDCNRRRADVLADFAAFNIPVNLFLFPNNAMNGNIENLLADIATNRQIMECFLEYERCVSGHPKPLNDSRIYSYLDMLLYPNPKDQNGLDLRKEEYRNYCNVNHWNLQHQNTEPLRLFLDRLIS